MLALVLMPTLVVLRGVNSSEMPQSTCSLLTFDVHCRIRVRKTLAFFKYAFGVKTINALG